MIELGYIYTLDTRWTTLYKGTCPYTHTCATCPIIYAFYQSKYRKGSLMR